MVADRNELTVAVAQFPSTKDVDANLAKIAELARDARARGAELIVFPEASTFEWQATGEEIAAAARAHAARIDQALSELAVETGATLIVGTFVIDDEGLTRNRMVIHSAGRAHEGYDKVHLYDSFGYRESDKVAPGAPSDDSAEVTVLRQGAFQLGLMNCYDLRFPEIARRLIDAGADTIVVSSAWVDGPHKADHWRTLLRARAIENTSYVIASNQPGPASTGFSMVVDPLGQVVVELDGSESGVACATLSRTHLDEVRELVPSLHHRKYHVVPGAPESNQL